MEKFIKYKKELFFILMLTMTGLFVGLILSAYRSVCTGSFNDFLLRPEIGMICGFLPAFIHIHLLRIINRISKGSFRNRPIFQSIQFAVIVYFCLMGAEFIFFKNRINEPSHKYWIIAMTSLAFGLSAFIFLYYRLIEMILTRLAVLKKLYVGIIRSLVTVLEVREPERKGHSKRVSTGCEKLGAFFKLNGESMEKLKRAALMHDLGKIGIDDNLLKKKDSLNQDELALVRLHPLIIERILAPLNTLSWETNIIKTSHFFMDLMKLKEKDDREKKGLEPSIQTILEYSIQGEKPEDLPIEARILSVADLFDTLTNPRPNKPVLSHEEALNEIKNLSGSRFDSSVIEALCDIVEKNEWPNSDPEKDKTIEESHIEEEEILKEVRKTAKSLNLLNSFFHYMGFGRHRGIRSFFLSIFSGLFLGSILGLFLFASTSNPAWFKLFIYQGMILGLSAWAIGYPIEWLLSRKYKQTPLDGPLGSFLGFMTGGITGSLIAFPLIIMPFLQYSENTFLFKSVYVITTGTLSGAIGTFYRFLQDSSYKLVNDQEKVQKIYFDLICALSFALEAKDPYTMGHSEKVSAHSLKLGKLLNLSSEELDELEKAALFHDIGKLGISQSIINKNSWLTEEEYATIKEHPAIGAEILEPVKYLSGLSPFVRAHHESYDGMGYPEKKKHEEIPLFARIIAITDTYDAMVSDRAYRKGLPHEEAISELRQCAGTQFDPDLVEIFIKTFTRDDDDY